MIAPLVAIPAGHTWVGWAQPGATAGRIHAQAYGGKGLARPAHATLYSPLSYGPHTVLYLAGPAGLRVLCASAGAWRTVAEFPPDARAAAQQFSITMGGTMGKRHQDRMLR